MIHLGKYNTSFVVNKTDVKQLTFRDPAKWSNLDYRISDLVEYQDTICSINYVGEHDLILTIFKNKEYILINEK
jgi:hypothetical protein